MRQRKLRPVGASPRSDPEVRAEQGELDDHAVVDVMQRDELVALVGECRARLGEVAPHLLLPVKHLPGGDDLVARMGKRSDRRVEVVAVLRLHVLAHDGLATRAQPAAGRSLVDVGHAALVALSRAPRRRRCAARVLECRR